MARKLDLWKDHCLVMPYLEPIPESERLKLLQVPMGGRMSRIEETLRDFAKTGDKQYSYIHVDIKWRHFGYWGEKREIFLYDLGQVRKVQGKDIDRWVTEALGYLRDKAGSPAPAPLRVDKPETQQTPKNTGKRKAPV